MAEIPYVIVHTSDRGRGTGSVFVGLLMDLLFSEANIQVLFVPALDSTVAFWLRPEWRLRVAEPWEAEVGRWSMVNRSSAPASHQQRNSSAPAQQQRTSIAPAEQQQRNSSATAAQQQRNSNGAVSHICLCTQCYHRCRGDKWNGVKYLIRGDVPLSLAT
jgi:hypothetical protein